MALRLAVRCFHELAKRVRHERACHLLGNPHYPITQIAYRLGYADTANFSHAFRAASGSSPRQYRREQEARSRETPIPLS